MASPPPPSPQAQAHIQAQERLQALAAAGVVHAWDSLPNYDEQSVAPFLAVVVPLILAVQHRSALLTSAFLAQAVGRHPATFDVSRVTGEAIRSATPAVVEASQRGGLRLAPNATGVPPQVVYRRPFVDVWTALQGGKPWADAVSAGRARASGTAAMDVQNTMRHTLRLIGDADPTILGYRRVPDSDPCAFCLLIAGRRYLTSELQPVHERCACSVDVITAANRGDFTGKPENDLSVTRGGVTAAVEDHGELGPLLVDGSQHFTALAA